MAMTICMILLSDTREPATAAVAAEIQRRYPELAVSDVSGKDGTASMTLQDCELYYGLMPAPIPWSELAGPCASSVLWRNAEAEVRAHAAHLVVSIRSDLSAVARCTRLTQVTAAMLAVCENAIGVYWGNSTLVIPKALFVEFAQEVLPHELPLDIWIDFRIDWETETTSSGFTQGMRAFGLMEIEAKGFAEQPADLHNRIRAIATYLIENGPVIKHRDTVGRNAEEKIRVLHADSLFGYEQKVMRLQREAAHET